MAQHSTLVDLPGITQRDLNDPFLRRAQMAFDRKYLVPRLAVAENEVQAKRFRLGHIGKHIGTSLYRLLQIREIGRDLSESDLLGTKVLPDLLIARTRLAIWAGRYNLERNLAGMHAEDFDIDRATKLAMKVRGLLDSHDERHELGMDWPSPVRLAAELRRMAIPALHEAGLILAVQLGQEPSDAHQSRLEAAMIEPGVSDAI